jgi:CheY-like chemotaxis protein
MNNAGTILLIEDDYAHVFIFEAGFRRRGVLNPVHIARSIEEARCYLAGTGVYGNRSRFPRPVMLLLDWDISQGRGIEMVTWIRNSPEWRDMPIVAFGNGESGSDLHAAYNAGANAWFSTRSGLDDLIDTVRDLEMLSDVLVRQSRDPRSS